MSGIIHRGLGDGTLRIKKRPRWQLLSDIKKLEEEKIALLIRMALAEAKSGYATHTYHCGAIYQPPSKCECGFDAVDKAWRKECGE
jgi:hypothetical protein